MVVNAVLNLDYDGCCLGQNTLYTGTGTMILIPTAATTHNASESITNNWITDTTTLVGLFGQKNALRRLSSQYIEQIDMVLPYFVLPSSTLRHY